VPSVLPGVFCTAISGPGNHWCGGVLAPPAGTDVLYAGYDVNNNGNIDPGEPVYGPFPINGLPTTLPPGTGQILLFPVLTGPTPAPNVNIACV
jgi:hypothetical protein